MEVAFAVFYTLENASSTMWMKSSEKGQTNVPEKCGRSKSLQSTQNQKMSINLVFFHHCISFAKSKKLDKTLDILIFDECEFHHLPWRDATSSPTSSWCSDICRLSDQGVVVEWKDRVAAARGWLPGWGHKSRSITTRWIGQEAIVVVKGEGPLPIQHMYIYMCIHHIMANPKYYAKQCLAG